MDGGWRGMASAMAPALTMDDWTMDDGCRGMAPAWVSGGADGPKGRRYVRRWRLLVCGCWFLDDWTTDDGCRGMTPTLTIDDWTMDDRCRGMAPAIVSGGADGPKGRPYVGNNGWRLSMSDGVGDANRLSSAVYRQPSARGPA